jgi:hypothetical protein
LIIPTENNFFFFFFSLPFFFPICKRQIYNWDSNLFSTSILFILFDC